MRVTVLGLDEFNKINPSTDNIIAIRIFDKNGATNNTTMHNNIYKEVLNIEFDDVVYNDFIKDKVRPLYFTKDHANLLLDFIDENINEETEVVIHCVAGICRSPAVAIAMMYHLDNKDLELQLRRRFQNPNEDVLEIMIDTSDERKGRSAKDRYIRTFV